MTKFIRAMKYYSLKYKGNIQNCNSQLEVIITAKEKIHIYVCLSLNRAQANYPVFQVQ